MRKGEIYSIEDFQEFGEAIVELSRKLIRTYDGTKKLKTPIWECWLLAVAYKPLADYYFKEPHIVLVGEEQLLLLEEVGKRVRR